MSLAVYANEGIDKDQIQERIQPIGKVSVQEKNDLSTNKINPEPVKQNKGQETYEHFCTTCHQDGLVGAPKFGSESDWKPRLAGRTMDDLVVSAMKGLNAMPAQGTCTECGSEDIQDAIQYMLPKNHD